MNYGQREFTNELLTKDKNYNKKFFFHTIINKTELSKYYIKRFHNKRNYIR